MQGVVLKLRCLFMKMRSLLEVPLMRLGQVLPFMSTCAARRFVGQCRPDLQPA